MFSWMKNWFADEQAVGGMTVGENKMFATIKQVPEGFALTDRHGQTIATYTRARDAKRGAARRGLTVA